MLPSLRPLGGVAADARFRLTDGCMVMSFPCGVQGSRFKSCSRRSPPCPKLVAQSPWLCKSIHGATNRGTSQYFRDSWRKRRVDRRGAGSTDCRRQVDFRSCGCSTCGGMVATGPDMKVDVLMPSKASSRERASSRVGCLPLGTAGRPSVAIA